MDIRATERPPTMGAASARCCALLLTAAVATAQAATGSEEAQLPSAMAGGETNRLAPPGVPTEAAELGLSVGAGETDNVFLSAAPTTSHAVAVQGHECVPI